MVSRRRALALAGATLSTVTGCLGRATSTRLPKISWITLVNERETGYRVWLDIDDGQKQVYNEMISIDAGGKDRIDDPVSGRGKYVVQAMDTARMTAGHETSEVDVPKLADGEIDCVGIQFTLLDGGGIDSHHRSMKQC